MDKPSSLEADLQRLQIQDDTTGKMLPQEKCTKLAFEASCAVVIITCWKKLKKGTSAKDTTEILYSTGFIIGSTKSTTLIMTSAHFLNALFTKWSMKKINSDGIITVGFFDKDTETLAVAELETLAKVVYLDSANDICLLQIDEGNHAWMVFGGLKYEDDKHIKGLPVCAVSHPTCHSLVQKYIFTMGTMGQRCIPVPDDRLAADCDCLIYSLPMNKGSSGAPVFDYTGAIVAMHSHTDQSLSFGIGLKSIKKALLKYFGLPKKHVAESTSEIMRLGLQKQIEKEFGHSI